MVETGHLDMDVRCPACTHKVAVRRTYPPDLRIMCSKCGKKFRLMNALPKDAGQKNPFVNRVIKSEKSFDFTWVVCIVMVVLCAIGAYWAHGLERGMDGPTFLVTFLAIILGVTVGQWLLRNLWEDAMFVSILASVIILSIALGRYFGGSKVGMSRWGLLIFLTVVGVFLQFMRAKDSGGGWGFFGGCGVSGCGGGGCGGGGCGGCGG